MAAPTPEWLRAFTTREERFTHGAVDWSLVLPANSEDLLDAAAFENDERLPYWADLWPSAKRLARHVLDGHVHEQRGIELGSGVALVSMALRARGRDVIATDYEPSALRFAELNAARNALGSLKTRVVDWREPPTDLRAELVIAADVLYERRNAQAIAALLPTMVAPGGRALLADPRRPWRAELIDLLHRADWIVTESPLGPELGPGGKAIEIVLLECRCRGRE
jgi:predicted nicotinamide N-methyase